VRPIDFLISPTPSERRRGLFQENPTPEFVGPVLDEHNLRQLGRSLNLRSAGAPRRATRPLRATIASEQRADDNHDAKEERLDDGRQDQDCLASAMAQGDMGQIEERRSVWRTGIQDFENGLKVPIQINSRPRKPLEGERLIAVIPPAMWNPMREADGFTSRNGQTTTVELRRQRAGGDQPRFVLEMVDVQRRTLPVRRQRPPKSEHDLAVALLPANFQNLAGMPVCQSQNHRTIDPNG
jgi:hypothetical protein